MTFAAAPDPAYALMRDWTQRWSDLESDLARLLLHPHADSNFCTRLQTLQQQAHGLLQLDPDASLYWLLQLAASTSIGYSSSHALVCWALSRLVAPSLACSAPQQLSLAHAALTMNIAMTPLQNTLAEQPQEPSAEQRAAIETHAARSAQWLRELGVTDADWLHTVELHHEPQDDLDTPTRLLQAVDRYAAQISPRETRAGRCVTDSGRQAVVAHSQGAVNAIGHALLRTVGICPPGSYVRLEDESTAVVLRRTDRPDAPWVAQVLDAAGAALADPTLIDTRLDGCGIAAALVAQTVRVRLNHARLLHLSRIALAH
jgi:HD-GYP domain-containing protein (c-di-GMP phosphodiesterase class II)